MASFPCDLCESRFRGRAVYCYPALVDGAEAHRERYRLCPTCTANLRAGAQDRLKPVVGGDYSEPDFCWLCKTATGELWAAAFFLTIYASDEREDWYGGVCEFCYAEDHAPRLIAR